ncbi:MAG: phosphodiester glycosidase family protein [Methyloceanibacter sp.]|uniref:phosphodiester glycosidase family protein n=1 Tax=Methyloceanibacter sp. TaxID=1965321 RepID=UPI003D6D8B09
MTANSILLSFVISLCLALSTAAEAGPCRSESFNGASYIVCSFDPSKDDLRIVWRGADGEPYRTFDSLAAALEANNGRSLRFAMNGGMYEEDLRPVGLHVENGKELAKANTATVKGPPGQIPNFYKKPNGVFYLGGGRAGVLTTERFLARKPKAAYATQSGPMLVIDGDIHPSFIVNSKDLKPRNGVGVSGPNQVHFVITRGSVSFYEFARFFRDGLGVKNALFLDGGTAPGLYAPELGRNDPPSHGGYGPIIAVVE